MIYKIKDFVLCMKKESLFDIDLINVCKEMLVGFYDVDLGGNVYKKCVVMGSKGKRVGYRIIVGVVIGDKYFFFYVFVKNVRVNINVREKLVLKELVKEFICFF